MLFELQDIPHLILRGPLGFHPVLASLRLRAHEGHRLEEDILAAKWNDLFYSIYIYKYIIHITCYTLYILYIYIYNTCYDIISPLEYIESHTHMIIQNDGGSLLVQVGSLELLHQLSSVLASFLVLFPDFLWHSVGPEHACRCEITLSYPG